jgi:hypothetical protein
MKCVDCGIAVKPNAMGAFREVTGWTKNRPGGGANGVILRVETGKMLCAGCGERRRLNDRWGVVNGQESLI